LGCSKKWNKTERRFKTDYPRKGMVFTYLVFILVIKGEIT